MLKAALVFYQGLWSFAALGVGLVLISGLHSVVVVTPPLSAPGGRKIRALAVHLHRAVELYTNCSEARLKKILKKKLN